MREKPLPEPPDDVPLWFMTYSDVITLMMTFFILLLTFSTSDPERFEQMKVSVFGASGSSGLVGKPPEGMEKDSWSVRVRPRSARLTDRGSETPPITKDAPLKSVGKGLAGLTSEEERKITEVIELTVPGESLGSTEGELYEFGIHNLKILANTIRDHDYSVTLEFNRDDQMPRALASLGFLLGSDGVEADQVAICQDRFESLKPEDIRLVLRKTKEKTAIHAKTQAPQ